MMLNNAQNERLRELFAEGSELPADQRHDFVQRACSDDAAVQSELAELLDVASETLDGFLAEPAVSMPATGCLPADSTSPEGPRPESVLPQIDGYAELQRIAEGGMGTVYKAMQVHPVRRTVAIKVIRRGMDSDGVLARFDAERQALALMSHPYIAAVHDAGTDSMGRPYLAMEFVDGLPITEFCTAEQVSLGARLELFIKVCHAVDHAHRRGVLHRDLKPSNVLVCGSADQAHPKVIDFGIAKAVEGSLGDHSIHTQQGSFLGTPEYMSPEQMEGAAYNIDTRTDVYSLGVILYELVTGARPIDTERVQAVGLLRMGEIIREEVPPKPSTRLRELLTRDAEHLLPVGTHSRWARRLQGDLDWVIMRALEKEPDRRYGSPHELADDIEKFLNNLPVAAGPPSGLYRLRKFTRRYRVQVVAGVLLLLSLLLGLFGTSWFLIEAKANEVAADTRAAEAIAAKREADGVRLAAEAALLAKEDANTALLLSLEAARLTDSHTVNNTIYGILPQHDLVGIMDGHERGVKQTLCLDDGRLLSRGGDTNVLLWDPDKGKVLRRFVGHTDLLIDMVLDPQQKRLLTLSADQTIRLWDVQSGGCLSCRDIGAQARKVVFSGDGDQFAVRLREAPVRVYSAATCLPEYELGGPDYLAQDVAFHPNEPLIATCSLDSVTRIWNSHTGELLREFVSPAAMKADVHDAAVYFPPCGDRVVTLHLHKGQPSELLVATLQGAVVAQMQGVYVSGLLADNRMLVSREGSWALVNLQSGELLSEHQVDCVRLISCDLLGRWAIGYDRRSDLRLVNLQSNVVRSLSGSSDKTGRVSVAFHPDGSRVFATGRTLRGWNLAADYEPFAVPSGGIGEFHTADLAWGTQPLVLWPPSRDRGIWEVWDVAAQQRLASIAQDGLLDVKLSPCGTKIVGLTESRLIVFGIDGQRTREIPLLAPGMGLRVRPDGGAALIHHPDLRGVRSIAYYPLESGGQPHTHPHVAGHTPRWPDSPPFDCVAVTHGGQLRTEVVKHRTGEVVAAVTGPARGWHVRATTSPDGRYLLVAMGDNRATVWDLQAGPEAAPVADYPHLAAATSFECGFAAHGKLAWVACANEVHLFESRTGEPFTVLRLRERCVGVASSADGKSLVTVTREGLCQIWPLDPVASAQRLAAGTLSLKALQQYRIGSEEQMRARHLANLLANPKPRNFIALAHLEMAEGNLDEAIAAYQEGCDLAPMSPLEAHLYLGLVDLLCQRIAVTGRADQQRTADHSAALATLKHALRCRATREQVLAVPSIDAIRGTPYFDALMRD